MKKLPIGISTLKTILGGNYLYVDKTNIALDMIENGQYYFLSRPRRFGKSLFVDTLKEIFQGNKELFKGLYIYDKYKFEKHPVIQISFGSGNLKSIKQLHQKIKELLNTNQELLEIECDYKELSLSGCFKELIYQAHKKYQKGVVVLIDEYDKPILDNITNKGLAKELRDELKGFYSVIKDSDEFIKFVFMTGVSKFSKVSLFSGLNNLNDITVDKSYSTICGYTQNDVETVFKEHLKNQDFEKIKEWYNGYKWLGEGIYNPFDILLFIQKDFVYSNYWFSTATPTFLLEVLEQNNYYLPDLENLLADNILLDSFDVDDIRLEILMWQTGYLTITDSFEGIKGMKYHLKIPNKEVQISLYSSIADYISKCYHNEREQENIYQALVEKDFSSLEQNVKSLFGSIGYNNFTKNKLYEYEGYYVSVFYAYLKALGIKLVAEDITNKGRIDLSAFIKDTIFIIEFKVDGKKGEALEQIKEKKYYEKYLNKAKKIYLVGIEFSKKDKNISFLEWEKVI